ncbi:HET-domain-containing protein [Colletotrichum asianum]
MGEVYQYGECNTAATGYDHGNQSLFGTRDAIPFQQFPVYIDCYFRGNPGQHFKGFYVKVNERGFRDAVINGPLDSRGWVAQEWALSPAVLHYTPEEIWWDCDDRIACETLPSGAENWDPLELCTNRRIRSLIDGNKEPSYRFWRSFIQLYAHTETTFEKDRFPAVAGIARILGNMLHEGFIAGIWEGDIVRSLVWECRDELSIPSTHLAPSWSWACVCGRISGWGFETNSLAHQLGCVSIQVLSDIDGFTSDLEATSLEKSNVRALAIQGPLRKLPHDLSVEIGEGINGVRYVDVIEDRYRMNLGLQDGSIPDEQAWRLEGSTHLLPLAKDEESVYGLLIQHVPEAPDPNTFRRSGKVHFYFDTIEVAEEYLGISQKDGEYQPSWRFRECGVQDVVLI